MTAWTDDQWRKTYSGVYLSKVVGVTFEPGYPGSAFILMDAAITFPPLSSHQDAYDPDGMLEHLRRMNAEKIAGVLIRDPDNFADPNSVEVHAPMLECRLGFLPRKLAAIIAPCLDSGKKFRVSVWAVRNLNSPEHPGVRVSLEHVNADEAQPVS